jgi:hypothetical protein
MNFSSRAEKLLNGNHSGLRAHCAGLLGDDFFKNIEYISKKTLFLQRFLETFPQKNLTPA